MLLQPFIKVCRIEDESFCLYLFLSTAAEPLPNEMQPMCTVWMSVLAVLTIQFARTIALALTISDFFKNFADRFLLPIVRAATPQEYQVCYV